jgi:hypothetical protein
LSVYRKLPDTSGIRSRSGTWIAFRRFFHFILRMINNRILQSSAPEQRENFSLHIRGVGQWTNRLYAYVEEKKRVEGIQSRQASRKRYQKTSNYSKILKFQEIICF